MLHTLLIYCIFNKRLGNGCQKYIYNRLETLKKGFAQKVYDFSQDDTDIFLPFQFSIFIFFEIFPSC